MSPNPSRRPTIGISEWKPGTPVRELTISDAATTKGSLWIDVQAHPQQAPALLELLKHVCGDGLSLVMVEDLLQPDTIPEVRHWSDTIRKTSSFGVAAVDGTNDPTGLHGLRFELVEFLCGEGWLVSNWQGCAVYRAGRLETSAERSPLNRERVRQAVARRWAAGEGATAGDLGILVLHELALEYSKARRSLWAWLDDWELEFYRSRRSANDPLTDIHNALDSLSGLHQLHQELRRRLSALNLPRELVSRGWFEGITLTPLAERVDHIVDVSLADLRNFSDTLRSSVGLTHSYATARQLALAEEQQRTSQRVERKFELIAAALLVPTLVATVYGANTQLPGRNDWTGFLLMVGVMALSALLTFVVIDAERALRATRRVSRRRLAAAEATPEASAEATPSQVGAF